MGSRPQGVTWPQELDPSRMPLGSIFMWKNQMWRRGKGIIYRARPGAPFMTERWLRRRKKHEDRERRRRDARRIQVTFD